MKDAGVYVGYDSKRDRYVLDFQAASDEAAKVEFGNWYRGLVTPSKWEHRVLLRYALFRIGSTDAQGAEVLLAKPVCILWDEDVRLSYMAMFHFDPPSTDAEMAELDAEFARLDALDAARIARRGNEAA